MFEHRSEPILSTQRFARRMVAAVAVSAALVGLFLAIGMIGYNRCEKLSPLDSLLEASMILAGEGPIHQPHTDSGKVFASIYAIFSGVVFITTAATLIAPLLHRVMHRLHLDDDQQPTTP